VSFVGDVSYASYMYSRKCFFLLSTFPTLETFTYDLDPQSDLGRVSVN